MPANREPKPNHALSCTHDLQYNALTLVCNVEAELASLRFELAYAEPSVPSIATQVIVAGRCLIQFLDGRLSLLGTLSDKFNNVSFGLQLMTMILAVARLGKGRLLQLAGPRAH